MSNDCLINRKNKEIKCNLAVNFDDPEGLCILHSQQTNKNIKLFIEAFSEKLENGDYDFRYIIFPCNISFKEKIFNNIVNFGWAIFKNGADFMNANFEKGVIFSYAEFYGARINKELPIGSFQIGVNFAFTCFNEKADFSNTKFETNVIFNQSEFHCAAEFYGIKIKEFLSFYPNLISDYVNFRSAEITGILYFHLNEISELSKIYFTQAKISGLTTFWLVYPIDAEFYDLEIEPQAKVKFESNSSLIRSKFTRTDLRLIEFNNVNWPRCRGRFIVYDEIILRDNSTSPEFAQVEALYRQLKQNYERQGDFKRVGDFHYGEMEMHRKANFWRRRCPISWYNLYWALSGYGERPWRALVWLISFLFCFAGIVCWSGLLVNDYGNMAGIWDSIIYILQKASLQRPEWPKANSFGTRFWSSLSVLLIPGQAALFLLALRNRLGRRR